MGDSEFFSFYLLTLVSYFPFLESLKCLSLVLHVGDLRSI